MDLLQVKGKHIVDGSGRPVHLRGVCFGGWLNMENFIAGYLGTEDNLRQVVRRELGEERYHAFFEGFRDAFIGPDDFAFLRRIGVTAVRIPFNYRMFESDMNPGTYDERGFHHLDRAIAAAREAGIYVILDLHAAPGWQNEHWHSDNAHGVSLLWHDRNYQIRGREIWRHIARHYRGEPAVAGYNLLNEPNAPSIQMLNDLYNEWIAAIREVDPDHIVFLEGNNFSRDFAGLEVDFKDNIVFSSHNYTIVTHRARMYPGWIGDLYVDRSFMERTFLEVSRWLIEQDHPAWVGEFGALFDGPVNQWSNSDAARLKALADQLDIFNAYDQHWTIWTYKDVGVQGLAVSDPNCEYMRRIRPILALKRRLGTDAWLAREEGWLVGRVRALVEDAMAMVDDFSLDRQRIVRGLVERGIFSYFANQLAPLYVNCFADLTANEIREMMTEAFAFSHCVIRQRLVEVIEAALKGSPAPRST